MKKLTITTLIALMSVQPFAADIRDASLQMSSKTSEKIIDAGGSSVDAVIDVADFSAEKLKAFISKNFASSIDASGNIGKAIVKLAEFSKPVFKLTSNGIAMVFEVSEKTGGHTLEASKKLVLLLDPSLEITGDVLVEILNQLSKGSEISSDVSEKIFELLEKPLELTNITLKKLFELIEEASVSGTKVSEALLGSDNLENAVELSGKGVSLTSEGVFAALYFVTKSVSAISNIFEVNKEEIEKAIERNDQEVLAGLRELIRAEIEKEVNGGEDLNKLLSDEDLDFYIEAKLLSSEK